MVDLTDQRELQSKTNSSDTVDGRNPAPVDKWQRRGVEFSLGSLFFGHSLIYLCMIVYPII